MSTEPLTPTSYLVLGLLAREGPSTPYELKRHIAATVGHFWSFPHTLLYGEPARMARLGLLSERREDGGRRRRIFTITQDGRDALRSWLARPSQESIQLRDPGLLQLFFADLGPPGARSAIAAEQLAIHRAKLAGYEADHRAERGPRDGDPGHRTAQQWRQETVRMGLLYERAALDFWGGVAGDAGRSAEAPPPALASDDGPSATR